MADKKGATPDDIMSAAAMKPVLAKAKEGPINCAIGLTDAKDGVALLHAKTKPKKLLAEMKKLAKDHSLKLDAGSLRFGTGQLDPDDNTLLRITVNKGPVGGMEAKLRVQMRNSGCAKVEFLVDASLEEEPEDDVAPADAPAAAAAAPEPPPPPPPPPTAPAPDAATLTATLAQLMQQIAKVAGADKTLQQSLVKIAAAANGALKGGDLAGAAASIRDLRGALAAAADTAKLNAQADGAPSAVTYAKSRLAWLAARNKVASEIDKLRTQIVATYQENGIAADLEKAYQTLRGAGADDAGRKPCRQAGRGDERHRRGQARGTGDRSQGHHGQICAVPRRRTSDSRSGRQSVRAAGDPRDHWRDTERSVQGSALAQRAAAARSSAQVHGESEVPDCHARQRRAAKEAQLDQALSWHRRAGGAVRPRPRHDRS